jgi:ABC-type transport system involved in multi-copper enzyme maturation permease subunit
VTILPLIQRQLRVRARGRAVYWTRFAVALVGIMLCLRSLSLSGGLPGPSQAMLGQWAFQSLVMAAFILCCCAGFLTVDAISRERREGTLGLLCLTRVKALDVLLGGFGAAGITCLCALVSILPVLMLPVLAGGVTGGEAFRTMLVLLDTMLLSLAAGLWASAGARGWFQSARSAVLLLLLIIVFPVFPGHASYVDLLSPLAAFRDADDAVYRFYPGRYWMSLAAVHGISWLLLITAGFRLRRAMREGDGTAETVGAASRKAAAAREPMEDTVVQGRPRAFTLVAWKIGSRNMADTVDPVRWLVRRQRGIKAVIWAGALSGVIGQTGFWLFITLFGFGPYMRSMTISNWPVSLAFYVVQGCLFGWAASRFFVEGRRTGELELLLTTPVGATTIISSQWKELRWLFFLPVIILMVPHLVTMAFVLAQNNANPVFAGWSYRCYRVISQSLGCVNGLAQVGALIWAGLWFGLRERSQATAIVRIILFGEAAPYVMTLGSSLLLNFFGIPGFALGYSASYWWFLLPQVAVFFYYVWLIRWASRRLAAELTNPSPSGFNLPQSIAAARAGLASFIDKARRWPPAGNP